MLVVKQFTYGKTPLGTLKVETAREATGLRFRQLNLEGALLNVTADGRWTHENGWQRSRFKILARTPDLGKLFDALEVEGGIEDGEAVIRIDARWNDSPARFRFSLLDGDVHLLIKKGRLKTVKPGGGRIFGLLSLQALPRRLTLDFSDLFRKGFTFDRIEGSFAIADGDAYTNDLSLEGPAASINISGRIGLASRDYDQTAEVFPHISSSMPIIGGLAGGPGAAVGLWLADRLLGDQIDKLSRVTYSITGSWDDPRVERVDTPPEPTPDEDE